LIAIGTELGSIELYSLKILLKQPKKLEEQRPTLPTKIPFKGYHPRIL
jgi:hypothetical protein